MKPRISLITLGVDDLQRSIHFYEKGLGFPRHGDDEGVAFFNLNGTWLSLFGRRALAEDANLDPALADKASAAAAAERAAAASSEAGTTEGPFSGSFNSCSLAHNVESPEAVDAVFAEALHAGATPVKQPQKVFWGGYSGYFKDPDGHLWEVAHNPFFWIGPED